MSWSQGGVGIRTDCRPCRATAVGSSNKPPPGSRGAGWLFFGTGEGIRLQHEISIVTMVFELPSKDVMGGFYQVSIAGKGID